VVVISAAASAAVIKTGFLAAGFVALACLDVDGVGARVGFRSRSSLFASIFKFCVGALLILFLLLFTFFVGFNFWLSIGLFGFWCCFD
jgi:hypothetical protein